jgi:hypothetical protein
MYLDLSGFDGPHRLVINAVGADTGDRVTDVVVRVEIWNDLN